MTNIKINKNKIIFDGHADDLETCNTITNICNSLNSNPDFETIKYEPGYAEFNNTLSYRSNDLMFAPTVNAYIGIDVQNWEYITNILVDGQDQTEFVKKQKHTPLLQWTQNSYPEPPAPHLSHTIKITIDNQSMLVAVSVGYRCTITEKTANSVTVSCSCLVYGSSEGKCATTTSLVLAPQNMTMEVPSFQLGQSVVSEDFLLIENAIQKRNPSYVKQNFSSGQVLTANALNTLQDGITQYNHNFSKKIFVDGEKITAATMNLIAMAAKEEPLVKITWTDRFDPFTQVDDEYYLDDFYIENLITGEIYYGPYLDVLPYGSVKYPEYLPANTPLKLVSTEENGGDGYDVSAESSALGTWSSYGEITYPSTQKTDEIALVHGVFNYCVAKGTLVNLANGATKPIEKIGYTDLLQVWNFDQGCFDSAYPMVILKPRMAKQYNLLRFSDGSELKTIEQHRIFNKQQGAFTYPMTEDTPIGTETVNSKGETISLISKEIVHEEVEYYNIITEYHFNLYANGILTSCRLSNMYPIDTQYMKYRKDNRTILAFDEVTTTLSKYYYDNFRIGELRGAVNNNSVDHGDKNYEDYAWRCINNSIPRNML